MKKKAPPKTKPRISNARKRAGKVLSNGLQQAIFGADPFGVGPAGFNGSPWTQQVSSPDTIFENLRWFFISNFRQVLCEAYVELGLVQTIVDMPVDDALRGGIEIESKQLGEENVKELQISLDRDDDLNTVGTATKWNRLFGGAGTLIITDQDPMTPFDIELVTEDSLLEFRAVDMWELFWDKQNTDGYDPEIQTDNFEFYNYYAKQMHKSRVMRMKGLTAPSFLRPRLRGWGFSVVETLVRSINQYLKATDLGFEVLDEFKVDVFKIKGLSDTLLSPTGFQQTRQRIQLANMEKNYQHAITMDSEDDYIQKQLSFAGLAEAMAGIRMQVAADMRIPMTKLFGQSAAGFSSGEDDIENYNAMIESQVRGKIKYDVLRILEIKCQKLFGFVPEDLAIEFKPLRVLGAEAEENVKTQKFNRLLAAKTAGEIDSKQFADACNRDNLLGIQLDTSKLELNPSDDNVAEEKKDQKPDSDVDDPGANREDTRKPILKVQA